MARRARQRAESGIYHVMLRGVNRDAVFLEDDDYDRFLQCLAAVREPSGCRILAYCLMPNHVHLVLRTVDEPVGAVVQRVAVRYVGWFNRKYERVGHLFQERFKSLPVEDDAYLVALVRYVWNNPVQAGLATCPDEYRWSSRRILGTGLSLVDEDHLMKLVPDGALDGPVTVVPRWEPEPTGRRPRHTDAEVVELLGRCCGVTGREGFVSLDTAAQAAAVRALRMRSVSYAQIAEVTGLSASRVRRLQVGTASPAVEAAG
nr:transposase [Propionicimonas sp.]